MKNRFEPSIGETRRPVLNSGTPPRSGPAAGSAWDAGDQYAGAGVALYPGSVLRDRFVLVEELGRGGMGVVYKAYDRSRGDLQDRHVAIKVLSEEFKRHPLAVKALQREARKAQKLAHPNIVAVHDFDRDGGNVYMVMELLSGRTLDQVLRDDGQGGIPVGPALEIIRCLAAALSYAHEHDIVHCDFKPGNAFLGRDGRVKVLDFGIARAAPSLTESGDATLFGSGQLAAVSPAYASMELLQGEQPDVRDDVYSFACVAYELLTGLHPYQRVDAFKAMQMRLEPRPVRKISRAQWRVLKQGLAFRRADRPPSIEALAHPLLTRQSRIGFWMSAGMTALAATSLAGLLAWKWPDIQPKVSAWVNQLRATHPATNSDQPASAAAQPAAPDTASTIIAPTGAGPARTSAATAATSAAAGPTSGATAPTATRPSANTAGVAPSSGADVSQSAPADNRFAERRRVETEMLKEQFETQALAGDVENATKTSLALERADPGSVYAANDIPRILALTYAHRAKTQFAAGQVNEAMQTLAEGRRRFGQSPDLKDLEVRYLAAAELYDRMSNAVVLNVNDTQRRLDELKATEGDEFESTAQMLAQTLADRIADHRAAGRDPVADKLAETGRSIFPEYAEIIGRGSPGKLPANAVQVDPQ